MSTEEKLTEGRYVEELEYRIMHLVGLGYIAMIEASDQHPVRKNQHNAFELESKGWNYLAYDDNHEVWNYEHIGLITLAKTRGHAIKSANEFSRTHSAPYPFIMEWSTKDEKPKKGSFSFEKFAGTLIGDVSEIAELIGLSEMVVSKCTDEEFKKFARFSE